MYLQLVVIYLLLRDQIFKDKFFRNKFLKIHLKKLDE